MRYIHALNETFAPIDILGPWASDTQCLHTQWAAQMHKRHKLVFDLLWGGGGVSPAVIPGYWMCQPLPHVALLPGLMRHGWLKHAEFRNLSLLVLVLLIARQCHAYNWHFFTPQLLPSKTTRGEHPYCLRMTNLGLSCISMSETSFALIQKGRFICKVKCCVKGIVLGKCVLPLFNLGALPEVNDLSAGGGWVLNQGSKRRWAFWSCVGNGMGRGGMQASSGPGDWLVS